MADGTLTGLIREQLGVSTEVATNREISSVGTSVLTALRENPRRVAGVIVNLSGAVIYIGPFYDVNSAKGIRLAPNGGSYVLQWNADFHMTGYEWFAVASAAGSAVMTLEVLARPDAD